MLAADPATGEFRRFLVGPRGCEITGFTTTPDNRTAFVNIQHPGENPGEINDPDFPQRELELAGLRPERPAALGHRRDPPQGRRGDRYLNAARRGAQSNTITPRAFFPASRSANACGASSMR